MTNEELKRCYDILQLSEDAKLEEVEAAYESIVDDYNNGVLSSGDFYNLTYAYTMIHQNLTKNAESNVPVEEETQTVPELEEEKPYKITSKNEGFFKRNSGIIIATTALALSVVALITANHSKGKNETNASKTNEIIETNNTNTNNTRVLPNVVVKEVLSASNIDEKVSSIAKANKEKGLFIDEEKIKSALFVTNIDYLSANDVYNLFGYKLKDIDDDTARMSVIATEIQNMYDYISAVRTHNNNGNKHISLAILAYDEEDKKILEELDNEYVTCKKSIDNKTITESAYQESFKYITEFFAGNGYLTVGNEKYSINSLTSGGGLLSEGYWPALAVMYSNSDLLTKENAIDIKTLSESTKDQPAIVNGSRFLGKIISAVDNCVTQIEDNSKTLTK